jgi:ABC-type Na+ efflux pump permease subunit
MNWASRKSSCASRAGKRSKPLKTNSPNLGSVVIQFLGSTRAPRVTVGALADRFLNRRNLDAASALSAPAVPGVPPGTSCSDSVSQQGSLTFGSGVWPVVHRELRAAARWRFGPWLRMGGALGGLMAYWFISLTVPESFVGIQVIQIIHVLLLGLIWAFVPALTADCIARERREGTLGLLFLTPLTASGIVLGKILAQTLRALTLWLAVLPVLTLPFLFGGVTWADVASIFTIELCAGMMGLAAGILASSLTDNRGLAFSLAFLLMAACVAGSHQFQDWRATIALLARPLPTGTMLSMPNGTVVVIDNGAVVVLQGSTPTAPGVLGLAPPPVSPTVLVKNFAFAAILLLVQFRFAVWRVERSWQDKVPAARRENWFQRYWASHFDRWLARGLRRTLEWNPIAWLQQYSWQARLTKWGLCFLFVALGCTVFIAGIRPSTISELLTTLLLILAAAYTFAGVNGLLEARKNGTLEVILVSPLSVNELIFGRAWGLWQQFLPSVLAFHLIAFGPWTSAADWLWPNAYEITAVYLMLPIFATYSALHVKNLLLASALTWAALLLPSFAVWSLWNEVASLGLVSTPDDATSAAGWIVLAGNMGSAWLAYWLLHHGLLRRNYPF